ncbi:hypothetical protein RFI_21606 [Reticulomyxa filosa]|uniref:Uncharacterized protein n=1 Tax=Reticulomyxa filosa TaxID=46433 RepID=X6MP27_RETFI|nr:hypothetical protein RFI_21606 [Reticulomyxa filosa]|eukprot:ETO15758.1 hypothetical protein RFI_21606 [Reticulomyxa filosa]
MEKKRDKGKVRSKAHPLRETAAEKMDMVMSFLDYDGKKCSAIAIKQQYHISTIIENFKFSFLFSVTAIKLFQIDKFLKNKKISAVLGVNFTLHYTVVQELVQSIKFITKCNTFNDFIVDFLQVHHLVTMFGSSNKQNNPKMFVWASKNILQ